MACKASESLSAYLDGELAPDARAELEAHLSGCTACSADLALLRGLQPRLAALPGLEPSPDLRRRVMNALPARRSRWRLLPVLAPLAALAAAVAFLVVRPARHPVASPSDLVLAENLGVVENLDALETADLSDQDLEVVAHLDQLDPQKE